MDEESYLARLQAFDGASAGPPTEGPDAVNQAMIRHWVEAMGDENPVYTDEEAARANGFPGVIAPPTMLQSWIMRGYKATAALAEDRAAGRRAEGASPADELMAVLDEGGFTSVVATNCEQEYHRPLVLGDRLSVSSSIESVSPREADRPRDRPLRHHPPDLHRPVRGHRWPTCASGSSSSGPARARRRRLMTDTASRPLRPRPALTQDNAFFFDGAREGKLLIQRCAVLRRPAPPAPPGLCRLRLLRVGHGRVAWAGAPSTATSSSTTPRSRPSTTPCPSPWSSWRKGTRLVADLVGIDPDAVRIGMPVAVEFVAVDDELTLPMFRPT